MVWEYERLEQVGIIADRRLSTSSHLVSNCSAPSDLRSNWRTPCHHPVT